MSRDHLRELGAFLAVAEEASFTRAARRLEVSQSALSQTIQGLEARLGLRLLARTTRSVSLTEAGERLRDLIGPAMSEIEAGLAQVSELRDRPAGTIRITADEYAVQCLLLPVIERFSPRYPDIRIEITTDQTLTDIVSARHDAGVRSRGLIEKDMVSVRIGPDIRMAVVGSPAYLAAHPPPGRPEELSEHACLHLRLPDHGEVARWIFRKGSRERRVTTRGALVLSSTTPLLTAAAAGLGLAWLPVDMARAQLEAGTLVTVLDDWSHSFEAHHLYYPSRRHPSAAFSLLLAALREHGPTGPAREARAPRRRGVR